jgi:1,4-alpha-glucan branching enzyme
MRFRDEKGNRLVQCAEDLSQPERVLAASYANCTWQTRTLDAARRVARGDVAGITDLGLRLGAWGFPSMTKLNGECLAKAVVHYVENHDHGRFVRHFAGSGSSGNGDPHPSRAEWHRLRPYLIALFTAKGVPMLWQGQEFASDEEIDGLAERDSTPMHALEWALASDDCGVNLRRLIARLARLRREHAEFRSGQHYFHDQSQSPGLLLFSRYDGTRFSLVALNFGDHPQRAMYGFARAGDYFERLHEQAAHRHVTEGEQRAIQVPPHHGCIWIRADAPPGG